MTGPGFKLDVRGRNIGRGQSIKGEEKMPRRQIVKLNNYRLAHHVR
jgi:hypothetical protein